MLDAPRPGHVGDVDQAVDPGLDLDERAERGQVAHLAVDTCAHGILHGQHHPRVLFGLLHPERDLLVPGVDLEYYCLDGLADRYDLGRMPDITRPAHLADVYQPFDTGLQLDERAVVRDADHLALHPRPDRVLLGHVLPRIGLELFQAQRDAFTTPVDVEHLHLDLLPHLHHVRRVRDPAVTHVCDVEQAVYAAQIDERAEIGDVLDHALPNLTDLEFLHQVLALFRPLPL